MGYVSLASRMVIEKLEKSYSIVKIRAYSFEYFSLVRDF
jgi:hypothetical protein